jgi:hypothetical protein
MWRGQAAELWRVEQMLLAAVFAAPLSKAPAFKE